METGSETTFLQKMDNITSSIADAKRYSNLVYLHLRASIFRERKECVFLFEDEGSTLSDHKIISMQSINSMRKLCRLEPYIVKNKQNKDVLTLKERGMGEYKVIEPPLPSLTSIYNNLMKIHLENDHASSKFMKKQIEETNPENPHYKQLPHICYDLIQYFCSGCNNTTGASVRGSVYFMYQMSLVSETTFHTLMIYTDENTEFMFLRPINVIDIEVANELFKIFMQIGTPEEININHTCKMTCYALQNKMRIICPTCEITIDNGRENDKYVTRLIMNAIGNWMRNKESKIWQLGCSVVQNQLNNTIRDKSPYNDITVTPYDLFYKNPTIFGTPETCRWFPDVKRQFIVDDFNPYTFHSNIRSKKKAECKGEPAKKQEEPTNAAIQTEPIIIREEVTKTLPSNEPKRGRGRPPKYQLHQATGST